MRFIKKLINKLLTFNTFLVLNCLILILKICYSLYKSFPGYYFEDYNIANNIVLHASYSEFINVGPTAYKLPVYPLFLSFFIKFFPDYPKEAIVVTQHLIYFFIPILIISILSIFNKRRAGIIAAYFFIFSPGYFHYSNVVEVTNVFIPIFLIWIYIFLNIYTGKFKGFKSFVFLGISTAILFLTQVVVVPFAVLMLFMLLIYKRINFSNFLIISIVAAFCYSPWIVRNYVVFDRFIVTKTPVWQNIYFGFTPEVNVIDDVKLVSGKHEKHTFQLRKITDEFQMENIYRDETLRVLKGNEHKFVKKAFQNAVILWYVPSRYFYDNSFSILFGRKVFILVLNVFTILALVCFYRKNKKLFAVSLLLFASFTAPYMIGHAANMRFKLDFEWYQYVLVSLFLYECLLNYKTSEENTSKKFAEQSLKTVVF